MALHPLPGFQPLRTHHCITGSLRHVYVYNNHPLSEELLLGIGSGVGFIYWEMRGTPPFIGGRANARGEFEPLVGRRTGVTIATHTTSSARKAERSMLELLAAGQPVMMLADMGFLPYLDFGGHEYHFGYHGIVVCGYDAATSTVLVADRDGPHPVSLADLARARGSTYKPFPPHHTYHTFDFAAKRPPTAEEARQAILEQAQGMLQPPVGVFGVPGIRKAARMVPRWTERLDEDALRTALFNTFAYIDATGGTGGGLFRYMFGRFLQEAATISGRPSLSEVAADFQRAGDAWQEVAMLGRQGAASERPAAVLPEMGAILQRLAGLEEQVWTRAGEAL